MNTYGLTVPVRNARAAMARPKNLVLVSVCTVILFCVLGSIFFWGRLHSPEESGSATIRNIGLLAAAVIAGILAIWRSAVAERQADTAQQSLLNERFQKAADMLGDKNLFVRLGGIYALRALAQENPGRYHLQVMPLFCAFLRNPPLWKDQSSYRPDHRQDVEAIVDMIRIRSGESIALERNEGYVMDLRGARLCGVRLDGADLRDAKLWNADLSSPDGNPITATRLDDADLSGANLIRARLNGAELSGACLQRSHLGSADLSGARLDCADLTRAELFGALLAGTIMSHGGTTFDGAGNRIFTKITQTQLDQACYDPNHQPMLNGLVDCETGELLIWRKSQVG